MPEPHVDGPKARLPWDRQDGETERQYSMFAQYRDSGRDRTVYAIADKLKRSRGYLYQLSRDKHWIRRAEAWDHEQDRQYTEKMADRRRRAADTTLAVIGAARSKLIERLQQLRAEQLTPAEWIRWLEVLTKLEREIMGQPSQTVAHVGADGGPVTAIVGQMTDDERKQYLLKLVAEAQSRGGLHDPSGDDEEGDADGGLPITPTDTQTTPDEEQNGLPVSE